MMAKQDDQIQMVILDIDSMILQDHLLRRKKGVNFDFIYEKAVSYKCFSKYCISLVCDMDLMQRVPGNFSFARIGDDVLKICRASKAYVL